MSRCIAMMLLVCVGGCASMPDVTARYYLPKSKAKISVVQTAACKSDIPYVASSVTVAPYYSADRSESFELGYKKLGGGFVNADVTLSFHDDGRLKSVNTSQTGQGSEVIKAGLELISSVVLTASDRQNACATLKSISDKPVTLTHVAYTDFSNPTLEFKLQEQVGNAYAQLKDIFGTPSGRYDVKDAVSPCKDCKVGKGETALQLREPAIAGVTIAVGERSHKFNVPVPQLGSRYVLPIPKGSMFGNNRFELSLSDSGSVTKLKYGKDSGSSAALGSIQQLAGAFADPTTADQLAETKAQADLIAQQQRLIGCQTDPATCQ